MFIVAVAQQLTIEHQGTKELFSGQELFHNRISAGWPLFSGLYIYIPLKSLVH